MMLLYVLAEHVTLAPSSITYVAVAVAGAVGAIHGIVKIVDHVSRKNGRNSRRVVYDCGLVPCVTQLTESVNKLCAIVKEQAKVQELRLDGVDKGLERVENELRRIES